MVSGLVPRILCSGAASESVSLTKYQYLSRTSETRLERGDDFER